mmetsp:Transcript_100056/g.312822  ORF Transcript_100056/g.312822 Transcript_100056/m.312822 type:complete len:588 (-) Transcript_100056:103-1866(-)
MHTTMRQVLVQALILLRNRDQFPCVRTLPMYFKLFTLQDKGLRKQVFTHIVRDIVQMNNKSRSQKERTELRDFFFERLREGEVEVARHACAAFISLYRQNVWRDSHVINLMSSGLLHPDLKISAALAHLFLGNRTKGLEGILDDSESEEDEEAQEVVMGIVGAKKTANREKRVKRAKAAAKRAGTRKKRKEGENSVVSFVAIDLLHDSQTLSERLLQRISKAGEPYLFRLLLLHLVARLVGRHELHLLNLYPFLLKYLQPAQKEVTKVLACLVESSHRSVPPDELRPTVLHVMRTFVTEAQASEVIEVGLNSIREVCMRSVNVLNEEELADLAGFRKYRHKGVSSAAHGLINAYRELHPQLLHRSLRGREATMALSRGEVQAPEFGSLQAAEAIDGLEILAKKAKLGEGEAKAAGEAQGEAKGKLLMEEKVLSSEDFKKLRKLKLQRSIELQLGRKRKAEEISSSGSESDSDEEPSDGERGLAGRLPDAVSGDQLKGAPAKTRTKAARMERIKSGRTDFKEKMLEARKNRKGGKTNSEKRRNKPQMMVLQSKKARRKDVMSAKQKLMGMKKHVKTLRKNVNHQKRRR